MTTTPDSLEDLRHRLREFARERNWEKFHNPKNLAMALAVEAAELMEPLQWLTLDEAGEVLSDVDRTSLLRDELADVLIYLVRLADILDTDLIAAAQDKIEINRTRYPPAKT